MTALYVFNCDCGLYIVNISVENDKKCATIMRIAALTSGLSSLKRMVEKKGKSKAYLDKR